MDEETQATEELLRELGDRPGLVVGVLVEVYSDLRVLAVQLAGGPHAWRVRMGAPHHDVFLATSRSLRSVEEWVSYLLSAASGLRRAAATSAPRSQRSEKAVRIASEIAALEAVNPRQGRIADLVLLGGLTTEQIASLLRLPRERVLEEWRLARAWIGRALGADPPVPREPDAPEAFDELR